MLLGANITGRVVRVREDTVENVAFPEVTEVENH